MDFANSVVTRLLSMAPQVYAQHQPKSSLPTFSAFGVPLQIAGTPAISDVFKGGARMFRIRITEGALRGPNFAGLYTVVQWGCGTGCAELAIGK